MIVTSITPEAESHMASFHWIPQSGFSFDAYVTAFTKDTAGPNLLVAFWNSMWIYIPSVAIGIFIGSFAAYAFAKLEFKAKKPLFGLLISGLTLPNCMGTIASFLLFDLIGWVGYMASLNGRFFSGGYSGHNVTNKTGKTRDYITENINNITEQLQEHNLKNISWFTGDYWNIPLPDNSLIYCDIPYRNTK
jgi:ABC-type maltose transport system permease subunit